MNNPTTNILTKCAYLANCLSQNAKSFILQKNDKIKTVEIFSSIDILNHFLGKFRWGYSPVVGEFCLYGAIDIDCPELTMIEKLALAKKLKKEFARYNLLTFIEQSKGKGYHVWLFFSEQFERKFIQDLLCRVIKKVTDIKIANGQIETFPKGKGGNAIFMFGFGAINPDKETFSEKFLSTKSTAILKDNGDVDANFILNIAKASKHNTEELKKIEWLDKYPPCLTEAYLNWGAGSRNSYTLAIAAILKKLGYELDEAIEVISTIASNNNDEELQARIHNVKSTYQKENPAGCSIAKGKCDGVPTDAICFENCSFIKTKTSDVESEIVSQIDFASFRKGYGDLKKAPPIEYLANNLFPRGYVSVFFSEAGCGKTWLLMDLSIAISNGSNIWGTYQTTQLKTLFFQGDSPEHLTTQRLELFNIKPNDDYLQFVNRYNLDKMGFPLNISDAKGQSVFEGFFKEFLPDLIIIDTFISFFDGDECRAKDVKASTDFLRKIADTYNCHIILTSHARKRQAGENRKKLDISDLIGSSALNRLVGAIYCIIPNNEDEEKLAGVVTNIKNWGKKTKSFKFELAKAEDNHLSIEYSNENITFAPKNKQEEIENHILDAIEYAPDAEFRKDELANDFAVSVNTAGIVINKLVDKKILKKIGETKGVYYIANIDKSCKNNSETVDNTSLEPNNAIDRKIDRKNLSINNPTIAISGLKGIPADVSWAFNQ